MGEHPRNPKTRPGINHQNDDIVLFLKRIAALVIDWLLATMVFGALFWMFLGSEYFSAERGTFTLTVPLLMYVLYWLGLWLWRGTTPGMMLLSLRIIDVESKATPQWWQWWVRYLGAIVALTPLGLGLLWALWDPRGRAWHDHIAGTQIVSSSPPQ